MTEMEEEYFLEKNIVNNLDKIKKKFEYSVIALQISQGEEGTTYIAVITGQIKDHAFSIGESKLEALRKLTTKLALQQIFFKRNWK